MDEPESSESPSNPPDATGFEFSPPPFDEAMAAQMSQRFKLPDWFGPPSNWLPGTVDFHHVAARRPDAVVLLSSIRVYPAGFSVELTARLREPRWDIDQQMFGHPMMPGMPGTPGGRLPDGLLRIAFVFADGSSASSIGPAAMTEPLGPGEPPPGPIMQQHGGGGGGGDYSWSYWCWPLPPEGDISVVCEWPAAGIERDVTTFAAEPVRAAANRAERLWDDPPEPPASGPVDVIIG